MTVLMIKYTLEVILVLCMIYFLNSIIYSLKRGRTLLFIFSVSMCIYSIRKCSRLLEWAYTIHHAFFE